MNYPTSATGIPTTPHFAVILFMTIHIPRDERSRTNPGHGYPAEDKHVSEYIAFTNKKEWEEFITSAVARKDNFVAMEVKPAKIETVTTVTVS